MPILKFIFCLSILALLYTYFGYPVLLSALSKLKKERPINKNTTTPHISVVISAYNEEDAITDKLRCIFASDYPKDKMEVIVVSDASTDKTDKRVKEFVPSPPEIPCIKFYRLKKRSGKIAAYRKVYPLLKGEIIIFTDATSLLNRDSISHLISNFNDPSIGCVGGLLVYSNPKNAIVGEGENKYWAYEGKIREHESRLCSLTSVSGTLYAVRKNLYPYNMKDYLADDLIVPLEVKKAGLRSILEPKAVCKEFTTLGIKEEMAKRIRITIQNIRGLIDQFEILNPFKYELYSLLVISHKLFRLMIPLALLALFISNFALALDSNIFLFIFVLQIIFYLAGCAGYSLNKKVNLKIINALFYFCLSNLAISVGIIRFFRGKKVATWEPIRANL